jgi:hypothetical protein
VEIQSWLQVEVHSAGLHLKGYPLGTASFTKQKPMLDDLVCQQRGCPVQDGHLHLPAGVRFKVTHQAQLPFDAFFGFQTRVEQHGDVDIAQLISLSAGSRSKQVGSQDVRLFGKVGCHRLDISLRLV